MNHTEPHLIDLAFQWPEYAENLFAQRFAEALKCSKAVIVLQDPDGTPGLVRLIGQHGLSEQEIQRAVLPHFDLRQESLSKLARKEGFVHVMWTKKPFKVGPLEQSILAATGMQSVYCCPLDLPDGRPGLIYAASTEQTVPQVSQMARAVRIAQSLTHGLVRQHSQQVTLQRAKRLEQVVRNSPDMITTLSAEEGTYLSVSRISQELLGFTPEQMIGRDLKDFMRAEEVDRFLQFLREVDETHQNRRCQCQHQHQNGSFVDLEWNVQADGPGIVIGVARSVAAY
ncbi:PAS domain-containing protein [Deinococcus cellulosilyticus]|uniref:PAS domain-containing protein n=1 Tax=Deinococcus cellulosilyticus (strain DSM 18568 / NBRC 106333 / KACC 11606 / 5516J-15) TaxID=1223518 RepID=A0A511NB94_DEIC1|nr:PAS domain-containing protein [Deinococcus cellulosilyticus]GEM50099.1 hypothetical protein DC3_57340 [Deinococcus cellulosilyticus NBRC 106333 = KACC 11606]